MKTRIRNLAEREELRVVEGGGWAIREKKGIWVKGVRGKSEW